MSGYGKNRQWVGVLYNENMRENWQEEIDNLVQLPFAYCVHDKGLQLEDGEHRKVHTHLILVWPAPTTYKHATEVFDRLSAPNKRCFAAIEPVYNAGRMYDYLIHNTEDCVKKGKHAFDPSERITGNNYDIGSYVQVSQTEKNEMFDKLTDLILSKQISNYADFVLEARFEFPEEKELSRDVIRGYSGYFERVIKGVYLRSTSEMQEKCRKKRSAPVRPASDPDLEDDKSDGILAEIRRQQDDLREKDYVQRERDGLENE